ncbi:MAG TPA: hypothetical protein VF280_11825 [Burkholderiales bacterium]|jgi:hypothetical protein
MKRVVWISLVFAFVSACDRNVPQRQGSTNEGKAAQSAAGGSSNEGKAVGSATGR